MLSTLLALRALFMVAEGVPLLRLGGFLTLNLDLRAGSLNRSVCLGPLGCFSNNPPFYDPVRRPLSLLPLQRHVLDVRFNLYSRTNSGTGEQLRAEDQTTLKSFRPDKDTKVVIHGFLDSIEYGGWLDDIRREYLLREDCNVVVLDWARANKLPYEQAVANARAVGAELALLIQKLIETIGTEPSRFHLVGHSLGAHVAGYAGHIIPGIARITGLDPAGPYFTGTDPVVRLDPSDANYVDVIHTDASTTVLSGLGTVDALGHVDFYPNGGNGQPGCSPISNVPSILYKGLARSLTNVMGFCDHMRAGDLFASSIRSNPCTPVGLACSGWNRFSLGQCGDCNTTYCLPMGEDSHLQYTPQMAGTKYFLSTSDSEPFCQYQFKVSMFLSKENQSQPRSGEAFLTLQGDRSILRVKLSPEAEVFRPGARLSYMVTTERNLGRLTRARFYWTEDGFSEHHELSSRATLALRRIVVAPLTVSEDQRNKSSKKEFFCFDSKGFVFPDQEAELVSKEKC